MYISNEPGRFEVYAHDRASGTRRQVTDRPEGTGYRVPPRLEPDGERVWWFDDDRGNEFGAWMAEPFAGGGPAPAAPGLAPSYSAGLALGRHLAVVGRSTDEGSSVYLVPHGDRPVRLYAHREHASVAAISRDDGLVALSHAEHGDSRNPAVRVVDLAGARVAELWDGPERGLRPGDWSSRQGDRRLLVTHERGGLERPLVLHADGGEQRELAVDLPGEVSASWYPDGERLLLLHEHRGRSALYRLELATGALDVLPTPPGTISAARVRPDGDVWLLLS
ncbi:MAG: TolB family protein, partial [Candidatus Limnocylindria bacterium]